MSGGVSKPGGATGSY